MLRATMVTLVAAACLMACSGDQNMVAPRPVSTGTGAKVSRATLFCSAELHPQSVTCTPVSGNGSAAEGATAASHIRRNVVVGKQNVNVALALSNFAFLNDTFSFNATVQNLMTQPIGTKNGSTTDSSVAVFFTNEIGRA